jgi:hypothetical protein
MIPYLLAVAGGYLIGISQEKELFAKGGKVSNKFKELDDLGDTTYFVRDFGYVYMDMYPKVELLVVATIRNLEDYIPEEEIPEEGKYELSITLVPYPKYISKRLQKEANDESVSISNDGIVNIVNYMGGLRYEPQNKVYFQTYEDALFELESVELNNKIDGNGIASGFILDNKYNRIGQSNWDYLAYMIGETLEFSKGGEVNIYELRKGDKVKTRYGTIETIVRKTGSGSYETIESEYTHSPESLEFVSRHYSSEYAKGGIIKLQISKLDISDFKKLSNIFEKNDARFSIDESEQFIELDLEELKSSKEDYKKALSLINKYE